MTEPYSDPSLEEIDWDTNPDLLAIYKDMHNDESTDIKWRQDRGRGLEKLIYEAFKRDKDILDCEFSYNATHEQVDGAAYIDNHWYIVEAKWRQEDIKYEDLAKLYYQLDIRMDGMFGLFISCGTGNYTPAALNLPWSARRKVIIVADGDDFSEALKDEGSLAKMVRHKMRAATLHRTLESPYLAGGSAISTSPTTSTASDTAVGSLTVPGTGSATDPTTLTRSLGLSGNMLTTRAPRQSFILVDGPHDKPFIMALIYRLSKIYNARINYRIISTEGNPVGALGLTEQAQHLLAADARIFAVIDGDGYDILTARHLRHRWTDQTTLINAGTSILEWFFPRSEIEKAGNSVLLEEILTMSQRRLEAAMVEHRDLRRFVAGLLGASSVGAPSWLLAFD